MKVAAARAALATRARTAAVVAVAVIVGIGAAALYSDSRAHRSKHSDWRDSGPQWRAGPGFGGGKWRDAHMGDNHTYPNVVIISSGTDAAAAPSSSRSANERRAAHVCATQQRVCVVGWVLFQTCALGFTSWWMAH